LIRADILKDDVRSGLANQIAEAWSGPSRGKNAVLQKSKRTKVLELGESFQIWTIGLPAFRALQRLAGASTSRKPIVEYACNTGRWRHQIRSGAGDAVAYAESAAIKAAAKPEGHLLLSLAFSSVSARQLGKALDWLERAGRRSPLSGRTRRTARLLTFPAFGVEAIWITGAGRDWIVLMHAPKGTREIKRDTLYDWRTFVAALGKQQLVAVEHAPIQLDHPDQRPHQLPANR